MGIFSVPPTETAIAGTVPVPVASMIAGSACSRSHFMVSPSDLCPSSLVSWKILAAHVAGIRILRPRPSTFVCRSLEGLFAPAPAVTAVDMGTWTRLIGRRLPFELDDGSSWWVSSMSSSFSGGAGPGKFGSGGSAGGVSEGLLLGFSSCPLVLVTSSSIPWS